MREIRLVFGIAIVVAAAQAMVGLTRAEAVEAVGKSAQIAFIGPEGMSVRWDVKSLGSYDSEPLTAPARYNFPMGAVYRLKLTNIKGRAGLEVHSTFDVCSRRVESL